MRRPLIILSPKSLLRHPMAISNLSELTDGGFKTIIEDESVEHKNVKKIILCSGKVFYDLDKKRKELKLKDVGILRMEQLYSFPYNDLEKSLLKYPNTGDFVWCQEEPANQGAWFSHRHRIQRVLDRFSSNQIRLVSRPSASAPAVGLNKLHKIQQEALIKEALKS
jgi:2-oxoglutarate dehydrogenase E1 component